MRVSSLTSLDLSECDNLHGTALSFIAQHCTSLTTLNISRCHQLTDAELSLLGTSDSNPNLYPNPNKLTHLNLSMVPMNFDITDEGIATITLASPNLITLNIAGCMSIRYVHMCLFVASSYSLNTTRYTIIAITL